MPRASSSRLSGRFITSVISLGCMVSLLSPERTACLLRPCSPRDGAAPGFSTSRHDIFRCMLTLRISPAEAFGFLRPERVGTLRSVAVQRFLPGVVRSHPQAGRPRDLQLHGREQAPANVLISHQERLGALYRRQGGGPAPGYHPPTRPPNAPPRRPAPLF